MELADVRDWLKTLNIAEYYYVGKLDNKQLNSIGIYKNKNTAQANMSIGGKDNTLTNVKQITLLVHCCNNYTETERKAQQIYNQLAEAGSFELASFNVRYVKLLDNEPIDVGTDDSGIYETVINLEIYYQRKE